MRKVVGLGLAGIIIMCLALGGTWAFLTDNETSSGNQLYAGTLDLLTDNANGVTQTITGTNLKPGRTLGPNTIILKNSGSIAGSTLDVSLSYNSDNSADVTPNTVNMTTDQLAQVLQVTVLEYDRDDLLTLINDADSSGWISVYEFAQDPVTGLAGLTTSEKSIDIAVQMRAGTSSDYCGDGINITLTFVLNQ